MCCLWNPQADDSSPDVWLQLLERCASISSCHPTLMRNLHVQLVAQQQRASGLQDQLEEQLHINEVLQQQASRLKQLRSEQEQQLGSQQENISRLQQKVTQLQHQTAGAVDLQGRVDLLTQQMAHLMQALQNRG